MVYGVKIESNPGNPYKPTFTPKVSSSGRVSLVLTGKVDLYQQIQSHKDSVDLKTLIARFESGEADVFSQRNGFYMDITSMPQTYAELHELMTDARNRFDSFPVDIRKQYNFDFGVYLNSLGKLPKTDKVERAGLENLSTKSDENVKEGVSE